MILLVLNILLAFIGVIVLDASSKQYQKRLSKYLSLHHAKWFLFIAISFTAIFSYSDSEKTNQEYQNFKDYSFYARLDPKGRQHDGGFVSKTLIVDSMKLSLNDGEQFDVNCSSSSMENLDDIILQNPEFPFSYYAKAFCLGNGTEWKKLVEKTKSILLITTSIKGHYESHDELLKIITEALRKNKPEGF